MLKGHLYDKENTRVIGFLLSFIDQGGLQSLLKSIKDKDPDKVSVDLASSLDTVAELELLQVFLTEYNHFRLSCWRKLNLFNY